MVPSARPFGYGGTAGRVKCTLAESYDKMNGTTFANIVRTRLGSYGW